MLTIISTSPIAELSTESAPESAGGEATSLLAPFYAAPRSPADLIDSIRETHRRRDDLLRAEGNLTRQVKSLCRRAAGCSPTDDAKEKAPKIRIADEAYKAVCIGEMSGMASIVGPAAFGLLAGREVIERERKTAQSQLEKLAKRTHVAAFVEATPGFGYLGLGQIIGEAGDLSQYSNPAKLWKRFGLGLISSGERQRKFAEHAKAIEAGYSPKRRSLMFVLGDSMLKKQGPYRDLYLARKVFECEKFAALGKPVMDTAQAKATKAASGTYTTAQHAHIRAQRYMEKRLLRELWRAWRGETAPPEEKRPEP